MKKNSIVNHISYKKLLKEFHPTKNGNIKLSDFSYGSSKKVWWKCDLADDHEWETQISVRTKGFGCPCCSGSKLVSSNCLATTHPKLSKEWHPTKNGDLTPFDISHGSNKKVWWKCDVADDHEWVVSINHRTNGKNCPCCTNQKVVKSNCLAITHPDLSKKWHPTKNKYLTPYDVIGGGMKKVWWKCEASDDHEWEAVVSYVVNGRGCPCCSGNKIVPSNCLATTHPDLSKEWHPTKNKNITPYDVSYGSHEKIWWKCAFVDSHEWNSTIYNRKLGSNCPKCRKSKGQLKVESVLKEKFINYESEKTFEDCRDKGLLKFDVYLPEFNILIEYDGIQHYQTIDNDFFGGESELFNRQKRDKIKDEYAKNNNIHLLRIPYTKFNNIESIINDFIKRFQVS